jgi:hypothetical protein
MNRVSSTSSEMSEAGEDKNIYMVPKSRFIKFINWVHVAGTYLPFLFILVVAALIVHLLISLHLQSFDLLVICLILRIIMRNSYYQAFWRNEIVTIDINSLFELGWHTLAILAIAIYYLNHRDKPLYLLDFACFEPPSSWRLTPDEIIQCVEAQKCYTPDSVEFMRRMLNRSGCGPRTAWPPSITRCLKGLPMDSSAEAAREESRVSTTLPCTTHLHTLTASQPAANWRALLSLYRHCLLSVC